MTALLLILSLTLTLTLTYAISNLYPKPYLTVHTLEYSDFFYSKQASYYFYFQFGEYDYDKRQIAHQLKGPLTWAESSSLTVSHTFLKPGFKTVNVTISDSPFYKKSDISGSVQFANSKLKDHIYVGKTSQNLPAPSYTVKLYIADGEPDCASFKPKFNSSIDDQYIQIALQGIARNEQSPSEISEWTRGFQSLGELPVVTLKNTTAKYSLSITTDLAKGQWNTVIPRSIMESSTEMILEFGSKFVMFGGCRIVPENFALNDFQRPTDFFAFGYQLSESEILAEGLEKSILEANITVDGFKLHQHECYSSLTFATFGGSSNHSSNNTGAYMILSAKGMDKGSQSLWDLTRNSKGSKSLDSETVCVGLTMSQCNSLQLITVAAVKEYVLFLTNFGLVSYDISGKSFTTISLPIADSLTSSQVFWHMSKLSIHATCFQEETAFVSFIYSSSANGVVRDAIIISPIVQFVKGIFQLGLSVADVVGSPTPLSFISMARQENLNSNLYLLGEPKHKEADESFISYNKVVLYSQTFQDRGRLVPYNKWPTFSLEYTFEDPQFEAVGMTYLQSWTDILVYGNAIYQGTGLGSSFVTIRPHMKRSGEYITEYKSIHGSSKYTLITNYNTILYGNTVGNELVLLTSYSPKHPEGLTRHGVYFDNAGKLSIVSLKQSMIHKDLEKRYIPIQSYVRTVDLAQDMDITLGLSIAGKSDFSFEAFEGTSGNFTKSKAVFVAHLAGSNLITVNRIDKRTGSCLFEPDYPNAASTFSCPLISRFPEELVSDSPALNHSISVVYKGAFGNCILKLNSQGGEGWLFSDIGKTVIINYKSFLIQSVYNSTHAEAYSSLMEQDSSLNNASWYMFDFRAFKEQAQVMSQSFVIASINQGDSMEYSGTLSNGNMKFSVHHDGMFLVFPGDRTFALVEAVLSESVVRIRSFSPTLTSKSYGAGEWSLFQVTTDYNYGDYPSDWTKEKSWRLTMRTCYVDSFYYSTNTNGIYMERNAKLNLNVTLKLAEEQLRSSSKGLFASAERISLINARNQKQITFDGTLLSISSTLVMKEGGSRGRSALTFKSYSYSITCPMEMPIFHIFVECNPVSQLIIDKENIIKDSASKHSKAKSISKAHSLPINYRPPSYLGRHIPVSRNIYNADPSQPKYRDYFKVSKNSGSFKDCHGKTLRSQCGCTPEKQERQLSKDSDCLHSASLVHYSIPMIPNINLYVGNGLNSSAYQYHLVELNNRTDYCASDVSDCTNFELVRSHVFNNESAIIWYGSELFHFRLELVDGSFCFLKDEFMVWVDQPPLAVNISELSLAGSCAIFGLTVFLVYLGWAFLK